MRTYFLLVFTCIFLQLANAGTKPLVIPQPAEVQYDGKWVVLNRPVAQALYFHDENTVLYEHAQKVLASLSSSRVVRPAYDVIFASRESGSEKRIEQLSAAYKFDLPEKAESYTLQVSSDALILVGADNAGLFYGLQTVKQLITSSPEGNLLPLCSIHDYPKMSFRGIYFYTGKNALAEQKELIDFMAAHKMNHVIIAMDYMEFESYPELRYEPFFQPQSEVKELIEYARQRYITPIPFMSVFAHTYWAFKHGHNLDIAENPESPRAFMVVNPRTYKFIFNILDEIIELYDADTIHIGMDEIELFAEYPYREESLKYTITELMEIYLYRVHEYFQKKGIDEVMIWGDEFLNSEEASCAAFARSIAESRARRSILHNLKRMYDKPVFTVCDWHYSAFFEEEFISLKPFHETGLDTIVSTWYKPENIRNFAHRGLKEESRGLLQTTWVGWNFMMADHTEEYDQFSAYLLASDYAWSVREERVEELPYNYRTAFWKRWHSPNKLQTDLIDPGSETQEQFKALIRQGFNTDLRPYTADWKQREQETFPFQLQYSMRNLFSEPIEIKVHLTEPVAWNKQITLEPGKVISVSPVTLNMDAAFINPKSTIVFDFEFSCGSDRKVSLQKKFFAGPAWFAEKIDSPIDIDGDLSDWKNIEPYVFDDTTFIRNFSDWTPEKFQAEMYLAHDEKNFYAAFKVKDDIHFNESEGRYLWQGDGIQFRMDFVHDREVYYNEDDLEIGFYLTNDGKIHRQTWVPGVRTNTGKAAFTDVVIVRNDPYTIYEIKIPLDIMIDHTGKSIGFSFRVTDSDSEQVRSTIVSCGTGEYGDTSRFGTLILQ